MNIMKKKKFFLLVLLVGVVIATCFDFNNIFITKGLAMNLEAMAGPEIPPPPPTSPGDPPIGPPPVNPDEGILASDCISGEVKENKTSAIWIVKCDSSTGDKLYACPPLVQGRIIVESYSKCIVKIGL